MQRAHPFSTHPAIRNKPVLWDPSYATDWEARTGTLEELRELVSAGRAFIPAAMTSGHRSSAAFDRASLMVVDIDNGLTLEQFTEHPLAPSAAWVYTTASHTPEAHRFRVIFQLSEPINDPDLYKALVTILIRSFGGDKSCTDPCRLYYGTDKAQHPHWNPEAVLDDWIILDATNEAEESRRRYDSAGLHYDDTSIQQAIYCLEQVIEPTSDGERDRFVRITAAASSAGELIFPAWSDWASRGHHGKGKNSKQCTERFFRGFHGKSTLGTLFWFADEARPGWRRDLPEELRSAGGMPSRYPAGVAGYDHEDFLGLEDMEDERPSNRTPTALATQSLFDPDRPWTAVIAPPAPAPTQQEEEEDDDAYDGDDFDIDLDRQPPEPMDEPDEDDELLRDNYEDFNDPEPPVQHRVRRRGRPGPDQEEEIERIKNRLLRLYPGLRLNVMSLQLEYGSATEPRVVHDPSTAYVRISRGAGKVFQKNMVYDVAQIVGYENRYHPVRRYIEGCAAAAQPCPYFKSIASELLGLHEDPYLSPRFEDGRLFADVIMERFLIGAVARVMRPGCTHDWMPILIGDQNSGKSTFFHYLTPPAFDDPGSYPWVSTIQQGIKTLKEKPHSLHAGWIVLLDEAERYFHRNYTEELKNLLSVSVDHSARKYENEKHFPRGFVLAGATNSNDFLVDSTGNRRFMPITVAGKVASPRNPKVKIIDLDRLKVDRDSIWAAAYQAYMDKPVHTFGSDELAVMADYLENFRGDNPLEHQVRQVMESHVSGVHQEEYYVVLSDLYKWLEIPLDRYPQVQKPVTAALKKLGWKLKRVSMGGQARRIWLHPKRRKAI